MRSAKENQKLDEEKEKAALGRCSVAGSLAPRASARPATSKNSSGGTPGLHVKCSLCAVVCCANEQEGSGLGFRSRMRVSDL